MNVTFTALKEDFGLFSGPITGLRYLNMSNLRLILSDR